MADIAAREDKMHAENGACQQALEYGIDLSVIEENLRLSVMQRLEHHQAVLNTALQLRSAVKRAVGNR